MASQLKWLCDGCLQEGRAGKFLTGDELSHGDLAVFCNLSTLKSGWLDGGWLLQQILRRRGIAHCMYAAA